MLFEMRKYFYIKEKILGRCPFNKTNLSGKLSCEKCRKSCPHPLQTGITMKTIKTGLILVQGEAILFFHCCQSSHCDGCRKISPIGCATLTEV
jgi:hypothetical protein